MKTKLRALSTQYDMLNAGSCVLCAVSGGADSMCLLHLLHTVAKEWGFDLWAAHFNHQLRGEESKRDEGFVRSWCAERDIPLLCEGSDVAAEAEKTGCGVEETARQLRYAFLDRAAAQCGATRIATAHTANDNAETMLFHLVRGSGLQGLTGIPPRRGNVVRPLLTCTRAEVEEYCAKNGVLYVEDSTNQDVAYTRNYLRHTVVPLLEQVNPRAVEHLSDAAQRLRMDQDCLEEQACAIANRSYMADDGLSASAQEIREQYPAIAGRVVRILMERAGIERNSMAAHVNAVLNLCRSEDPSGQCNLPGMSVRREYDRLVFVSKMEREEIQCIPVQLNAVTAYGTTGWSVLCRETICPEETGKNPAHFYLSCDKMRGRLMLRPRLIGDEIKLPGRPCKTLKKFLIDEKVPRMERERLPVLADEVGVAALIPFGPNESYLAQPGEKAIEITVQKCD